MTTRRAGFTLVEVLISMSLATVLIGITAFTFIQTSRVYSETRSRVEATSQMREALEMIEADLSKLETSAPNVVIQQGEGMGVRTDVLSFKARGSGKAYTNDTAAGSVPYYARSYQCIYKFLPPRESNASESALLNREITLYKKDNEINPSAADATNHATDIVYHYPGASDREKGILEIVSFQVTYRLNKSDTGWYGEETPHAAHFDTSDEDKINFVFQGGVTMEQIDGGRKQAFGKPTLPSHLSHLFDALDVFDIVNIKRGGVNIPTRIVSRTSTKIHVAEPLLEASANEAVTLGAFVVPYMVKGTLTVLVRSKGGFRPITLARTYALRR